MGLLPAPGLQPSHLLLRPRDLPLPGTTVNGLHIPGSALPVKLSSLSIRHKRLFWKSWGLPIFRSRLVVSKHSGTLGDLGSRSSAPEADSRLECGLGKRESPLLQARLGLFQQQATSIPRRIILCWVLAVGCSRAGKRGTGVVGCSHLTRLPHPSLLTWARVRLFSCFRCLSQ